MRYVLFSWVFFLSVSVSGWAFGAEDPPPAAVPAATDSLEALATRSALPRPEDPHELIGAPHGARECVERLVEETRQGIVVYQLWGGDENQSAFPMLGTVGLTLQRQQLLTPVQLRLARLDGIFGPLYTSGIIARAVAEEFRMRGYWLRSGVRHAMLSFLTLFPTYELQAQFLDSVLERVFHRLRESRGYVVGFRGGRNVASATELDRLRTIFLQSPYTGFAELQLYILHFMLNPPAGFADTVAWYVPRLLSPYRIWERITRQLWDSFGNAVMVSPEDREIPGVLRYLGRSRPTARALIVTRNLMLFTREQLLLIRDNIALSDATVGRINNRITELTRTE